MSSKTKIIVLRMKEIIYTAIFAGFAILLILLLVVMLRPGKDDTSSGGETTIAENTVSESGETSEIHASSDAPAAAPVDGVTASYTPGIYSASLSLGSQTANVEVTVDSTRITSVALVPLSDSVAAMYPLMQPAMEELAAQILEKQSLDGITCPQENRYTTQLLLSAVADLESRIRNGG